LRDQVRRAQAERLLSHPTIPLVDISHDLGYAEQSAFSRAFRKWTGSTPKEYRTTLSHRKATYCRKTHDEREQ
jgi:AraC-like DNA-binding protein